MQTFIISFVLQDGEDLGDINGDEGDADTDSDERRLVIDEGDHGENGESCEINARLDRSKNTVPHCQGCNERDAEFVCAGCQRQWYCSRECQVSKRKLQSIQNDTKIIFYTEGKKD